MTSTKNNYMTTKKEALAMIYIMKIDINHQVMIFFFNVTPSCIAFNKKANCEGENCLMGQNALKRVASTTLY